MSDPRPPMTATEMMNDGSTGPVLVSFKRTSVTVDVHLRTGEHPGLRIVRSSRPGKAPLILDLRRHELLDIAQVIEDNFGRRPSRRTSRPVQWDDLTPPEAA